MFSDKWGFFTGQEFREAATRVCFGNLSLKFKRQQSLCLLSITGGYPKQRNKVNQIFEKKKWSLGSW